MALEQENSNNRVAEAIYYYEEQEAKFFANNPLASRQDDQALSLKLEYYTGVYQMAQKSSTPEEKLALRFMRHEMAKMHAYLRPTLLNKLLYSNVVNLARNFVNGYNLVYRQHNQQLNHIRTAVLQAHNLYNLTTTLKSSGFEHNIEGPLARMLSHNPPSFHIRYADIHHRDTDFVLHFKKIPETDIYYFEKFDALARPSLQALLSKDASRNRCSFSLQDNLPFTAREAGNLVNGRSVCKNETWYRLSNPSGQPNKPSFEQIDFDLEKTLQKLPIEGLDNPKIYASILNTLQSGSTKEVTINTNGQFIKCKLEAAPWQKTVFITDKNNQLLDSNKLMKRQKSIGRKVLESINSRELIELKPTAKIRAK